MFKNQMIAVLVVLLSGNLVHADWAPDSPIVKDWMQQDGRMEPPDADYIKACQLRRDERLKAVKKAFPKIVFTKHFDLGGSHYAYTEAQSDAQAERNFVPGSALCLLELVANGEYRERTLISDPNGVIRDPAVSCDGRTIVFAWKKSDRLDDYHLYDYSVESGEIRQLTFGLGFADYEPCILPDGDIIFNSTRCVQIVDCWWTEVSNLYRCDKDGRFLRRLSYDQVHTNFPTIMEDGRIIYTRWDYNDRGQIYPQSLFQMNPDGTGQTEYYGNNSWFPTTLMHSRGIPNSGGKVVSVFSGHHNRQYGKLGIVDITKGRQENSGTQLIAPVRETTADRIDAWGQQGDRFAYPYPLNEREFLVGYNPDPNAGHTTTTPFGIYWIDENGTRELLAYDNKVSCHQPVPLAPTQTPYKRVSVVDHEADHGVFIMQDVYFGPGMDGIERGTAKTLRVIGLEFRSTGIGSNSNDGPAGGALVSTPVAVGNGTWDVKIPLGDTPIYEDGSASFKVPAKTPLYFQVLDGNGHVIQTMRSWATLQPGEVFSCIGCHEDKNVAVSTTKTTVAMTKGPQELKPFYGEPRGFSFAKEIQPILDRHCVECHQNKEKPAPFSNVSFSGTKKFNTLTDEQAKKIVSSPVLKNLAAWHYTTRKPPKNWMQPEYFAVASQLPVGKGGFGAMPERAFETPWDGHELWIWTTVDLPEDWVAEPLLLRYFHDEDVELYVNGKKTFVDTGYNTRHDNVILSPKELEAFKPGLNYLALHLRDTGGGKGVDIGLWKMKKASAESGKTNAVASKTEADLPFSLKNDPVLDRAAKRYWPMSYINLTNSRPNRDGDAYTARQNPVVNWINVQDVPSMLAPYNAGAAKSDLLKMFDPNLSEDGTTHNDVKLSREELDTLALWIDLLIPACGDYAELNAWDRADNEKFAYYEAKKSDMHQLDVQNNRLYAEFMQQGKCDAKPSQDVNPYRNLALEGTASSNSEYQNLKAFSASNAIDGKTENKGHGDAFPSWGPDKNAKDLWWQVDFGKEVRADQIAVYIRADFPHDTYWKECVIEGSNGFKQKITLQKTADKQVFRFPVQNLTWLKLTGFVPEEKDGWAAISEVEVFGIDDK